MWGICRGGLKVAEPFGLGLEDVLRGHRGRVPPGGHGFGDRVDDVTGRAWTTQHGVGHGGDLLVEDLAVDDPGRPVDLDDLAGGRSRTPTRPSWPPPGGSRSGHVPMTGARAQPVGDGAGAE
jgi:hypothetical protein